ncbi:hypothetical protein BDZ97DRAFT_1442154 [Flammula alnicola]|nr:hypothetical protein BDZ97DRAFT_1442154 [Flammula alnicola]
MQHDSSDILGQDTMPTVNASRTGGFPLTLGQTIFTFIVLFGIYIIGLRLWKRVLLWRERSYKLATRRRHGIPDSDLRPFNVAYSEAMMRAREEEGKKQLKPRPAPARRRLWWTSVRPCQSKTFATVQACHNDPMLE